MSAANSKLAMPADDSSASAPAYRHAEPMTTTRTNTDAVVVDDEAEPIGWYASMRDSMGNCLGAIGTVPILGCCFPNPYKEVSQGNAGLITRFGRFNREVKPGLRRVNPVSESLFEVSVRDQVMDVPQQDCMTKDNIRVTVSSVMYYGITDAKTAAFKVQNLRDSLQDLTKTTLRNIAGSLTLQELINDREAFARHAQEMVEERAVRWGVRIDSIFTKDILIDQRLQDSLSMAAQAKRTGEAKVIAAKAEVESAKLMRQAADILNSGAAMQIRYLDAMQAMAKTANSKVIFMPGSPNEISQTATDTPAVAVPKIDATIADPAVLAQQELQS